MTKLPVISGDECVRALQKLGFILRRQKGSHMILRRDEPFCQLAVPKHKVLDRGTLRGIIKQAGISVEELAEVLNR